MGSNPPDRCNDFIEWTFEVSAVALTKAETSAKATITNDLEDQPRNTNRNSFGWKLARLKKLKVEFSLRWPPTGAQVLLGQGTNISQQSSRGETETGKFLTHSRWANTRFLNLHAMLFRDLKHLQSWIAEQIWSACSRKKDLWWLELNDLLV